MISIIPIIPSPGRRLADQVVLNYHGGADPLLQTLWLFDPATLEGSVIADEEGYAYNCIGIFREPRSFSSNSNFAPHTILKSVFGKRASRNRLLLRRDFAAMVSMK